MASPFTFFRKNQQSMMVVLVILAMLVFTLDSVFSSRDNQFVVLGLLLGGTIFGIAGIGQGKWLQYGFGGAILGALCGWLMPAWLSGSAPANSTISSSLGAFDDNRIYDLQLQRGIADQFMIRATEAAFGQGMGQFATVFGFGHQSEREDVVFGELMRNEADELGIVVTNDMVTAYINKATGDKLTAQAFAKVRGELAMDGKRMTDEQLFDVLREEIKARMAFQMLRPQVNAMPPAPEVYYSLYRRLNVSQRLNTALIDVDAFLKQVPDPSDSEVADLFAKARLKFPNSDEPGSPGFRQPRKTRLAYLEVDYKKMEAGVAPVTDAEVEAHYNENRDTLYRRPVAPAVPQTPPAAPTDNATPEAPAQPGAAAPAAPATPDAPAAPAEPAAPAKEAPPTQEQPPTGDNPAPTEPKPAEPAAPAPSGDAPQPAPAAEQPADAPPAAPSETPSETNEQGGDCGPLTDEQPAAPAAEEPASGDKPAAPTTDAAPAAPAEPAQDAPTPAAPAQPTETPAATAPAAEPQPPTDAPAEPAPTDAAAPAAAPLTVPAAGDASQPAEQPFEEQKFEVRPLDDELKSEIRDQLLSRRVREAIEAKMGELMGDLKKLEAERRSHRLKLKEDNSELSDEQFAAKMQEYSPTINQAAKALADKAGVAYVETPFISYLQLSSREDYPIGGATPPGGNPFAPSGPDVATTVFSAPGDELQLFRPRRAELTSFDPDGGETHYAWWIIDNSESHVPTLDEPGIRDEVILTIKRGKARELAKRRATELAKQIRDGLALPEAEQKSMAATLENVTATGSPDAPKVPLRQTVRFTWMRQEAQQQMNFMQQQPEAVLSQIEFADETGGTLPLAFDDFMKVVFDDLQNNEVGVVPNADLSRYYVVQVVDRTPTPEVGEDELRQRFLTEGTQFGFGRSALYPLMQQTLAMPAVVEWEKALWRKYGVDPDAPPAE